MRFEILGLHGRRHIEGQHDVDTLGGHFGVLGAAARSGKSDDEQQHRRHTKKGQQKTIALTRSSRGPLDNPHVGILYSGRLEPLASQMMIRHIRKHQSTDDEYHQRRHGSVDDIEQIQAESGKLDVHPATSVIRSCLLWSSVVMAISVCLLRS